MHPMQLVPGGTWHDVAAPLQPLRAVPRLSRPGVASWEEHAPAAGRRALRPSPSAALSRPLVLCVRSQERGERAARKGLRVRASAQGASWGAETDAILCGVQELPDGSVLLRYTEGAQGGDSSAAAGVGREVLSFLTKRTTQRAAEVSKEVLEQIVGSPTVPSSSPVQSMASFMKGVLSATHNGSPTTTQPQPQAQAHPQPQVFAEAPAEDPGTSSHSPPAATLSSLTQAQALAQAQAQAYAALLPAAPAPARSQDAPATPAAAVTAAAAAAAAAPRSPEEAASAEEAAGAFSTLAHKVPSERTPQPSEQQAAAGGVGQPAGHPSATGTNSARGTNTPFDVVRAVAVSLTSALLSAIGYVLARALYPHTFAAAAPWARSASFVAVFSALTAALWSTGFAADSPGSS